MMDATRTCPACQATIWFVKMATSGKPMPIDVTARLLIPGEGPDQAVDATDSQAARIVRGRFVPADGVVKGDGAVIVHVSHFVTCSQPGRFRRRPERPAVRAGAHLRNDHR